MPNESDWVLNAPSEMDRALMRNRFVMDLSRTLGRYAPRAKFVEVFLVDNETTASLGMSDYMGVYTALEKIKRDKARVDIDTLSATDVSDERITGGYAFRIDRDIDFSAGGYDFGWVYPEPEEMATTERSAQVDYLRGYLDEFFGALTSETYIHPDTSRHYSDYIDVGSWIDYNLMTTLTKNVDGLRLSAYFYKPRNEPVVAGPVWDFDRSLGTPHDERAIRPDEWAIEDGTDPQNWGFWHDLFQDPEFADAYWQRWDELRQETFSLDQLVAMLDGYEAELTEARVRHFERWPELSPFESAEYEVDLIRQWLSERVAWLDEQRP
jgi:spore coat protein CotH